jgi:hypothetical protein
MRVQISQIEYHLPEAIVTNAMLAAENPLWDVKLVEQRSGVSAPPRRR